MGDGRYQLFQYFRAKLTAYLSKTVTGDGVWMIQADTIWRQNLFTLVNLTSNQYREANVVFDREGDEGLLASMIAGGYFYVRAASYWNRGEAFFDGIASYLQTRYATDNNVMSRQCLLKTSGARCAFFPYSLISNWRDEQKGEVADAPPLFQYDGGEGMFTPINIDPMSKNCGL
jgi:hypothetical protein